MSIHEEFWRLINSSGGDTEERRGLPKNVFPDECRSVGATFNDTCRAYIKLASYVRKVRARNPPHTSQLQVDSRADENLSLYENAFSEGVQLILNQILVELGQIEKMFMTETDLPMITLSESMEKSLITLNCLNRATDEIALKKIKGCHLVDLCNKYILCSPPPISAAFREIRKCCLKPFLQQISEFILYAKVHDPYGEFFISVDLYSGGSLSESEFSMASMSSAASRPNALPRYCISMENLPSFLPYSAAAKILFIGKSVATCQQEADNLFDGSFDDALNSCGLNKSDVLTKIMKFHSEYFVEDTFELFIDDVWTNMNKYTRKLVEEAGVRNNLIQMRDIYLLGRGEIFHEFLVEAKVHLSMPASRVSERKLKSLFENAIYSVYSVDHLENFNPVTFKIPKSDKTAKTLDVIELETEVKWPLKSIFNAEIIANYNACFKFLISVKRAHMDVCSSWLATLHIETPSVRIQALELYNMLLSLVGNLNNYCLTFVVASEMDTLLSTVDKTDTFTDIQNALDVFFRQLFSKLFMNKDSDGSPTKSEATEVTLSSTIHIPDDISVESNVTLRYQLNKKTQACFEAIFMICDSYSASTRLIDDEPEQFSKRIKSLKNEFIAQVRDLFKLARMSQHCYSDMHLLMNNLDLNGFFQKTIES